MTAEVEARKRLLRLVEQFPGLHVRELGRQADLSEALALYHLNYLADERLVKIEDDGMYKRFYPFVAAPSESDRELIAVLRRRVAFQIALFLLERKDASFGGIVEELGLAKSTISYHLHNLEAAGLLLRQDDRFSLREPARVARTLLRWEPTKDLTDRFSGLWATFYKQMGGKPKK